MANLARTPALYKPDFYCYSFTMRQNLKDLKEIFQAVLPVVLLIILLQLFTGFMPEGMMTRWLLGSAFALTGLFLFMRGVTLCLTPLGDFLGSRLPLSPKIWVFTALAILVGVAASVADPAVTVLSQHVQSVSTDSSPSPFVVIAVVVCGVGLALAFALLRVALGLPQKLALALCYTGMLVIACFTPTLFAGLALDSGGVATGPLTVPFLLALGMGFVAVLPQRDNASEGFGVLGMVALGPILGIMILGLLYS